MVLNPQFFRLFRNFQHSASPHPPNLALFLLFLILGNYICIPISFTYQLNWKSHILSIAIYFHTRAHAYISAYAREWGNYYEPPGTLDENSNPPDGAFILFFKHHSLRSRHHSSFRDHQSIRRRINELFRAAVELDFARE